MTSLRARTRARFAAQDGAASRPVTNHARSFSPTRVAIQDTGLKPASGPGFCSRGAAVSQISTAAHEIQTRAGGDGDTYLTGKSTGTCMFPKGWWETRVAGFSTASPADTATYLTGGERQSVS